MGSESNFSNNAAIVTKSAKFDSDPARLTAIQGRAKLYDLVRSFFKTTSALEVETPILSEFTTPEPFIDSFELLDNHTPLFLHTSPEFYMKRLLSEFRQDIFQISKVFRQGEKGKKHLREFTMLEWYRVNINEQALIDDVSKLVQHLWHAFYPNRHLLIIEKLSYKELFQQHFQINPYSATITQLKACAKQASLLSLEDSLSSKQKASENEANEKDRWLDALMSCVIDPTLGGSVREPKVTFIYDYPKSQSALARIAKNKQGEPVAKRFELYIAGIELANGFYELNDATEQRKRFEKENQYRCTLGKKKIPLDEGFLADLKHMPDCAGVALGIDRLLMLLLGKDNIQDIVNFRE